MNVYVDGVKFNVRWWYDGWKTNCVIKNMKSGEIFEGRASCQGEDREFGNKEMGRKLSMAKVFKRFPAIFDRESGIRDLFWNRYFMRYLKDSEYNEGI